YAAYSGFDETFGTGATTIDIVSVASPLAAPEPGTWALMILGAGLCGGALRLRRARARPQVRSAA
ncbi:MAG TPA: PEPxxWA-CTERM sorting domain-containing protein, partial [Caulobacteraceae bacterium]|nr:PEPxxWA-CTERM sorting domain-containing protein [Caulobacteraceae bacterium]